MTLTIFKSVIVPTSVIFKVEVIVGVPEAEIVTGTSVLAGVMQLAVVNVYVEDIGAVPQLFAP